MLQLRSVGRKQTAVTHNRDFKRRHETLPDFILSKAEGLWVTNSHIGLTSGYTRKTPSVISTPSILAVSDAAPSSGGPSTSLSLRVSSLI